MAHSNPEVFFKGAECLEINLDDLTVAQEAVNDGKTYKKIVLEGENDYNSDNLAAAGTLLNSLAPEAVWY